jgi:DNA-binding transcriptional ArsR family regulator
VAHAGAPVVDDGFGVLAHPIRRELLERLAAGDMRVTDLAEGLPVSRPAVSQHLRVMRDAGTVVERRVGRERWYAIEFAPLAEVVEWLHRLDQFWEVGLRRLGEHLDERR